MEHEPISKRDKMIATIYFTIMQMQDSPYIAQAVYDDLLEKGFLKDNTTLEKVEKQRDELVSAAKFVRAYLQSTLHGSTNQGLLIMKVNFEEAISRATEEG